MTILFQVLAALLVLIGLTGIVVPALPGVPLVFAGLWLAAWTDGFAHIGTATLVVLGVLTLLSIAVDFWSTVIGAKRVGASRPAMLGALLGTLLGLLFAPVGLFVGPFAGAALGELWHLRRADLGGLGRATRVGTATLLGIVIGMALKLMLAFAMLGLFALAWLI